jgi:hypothetical protein
MIVSGAEGAGDAPVIFFLLLSVYLLLKSKPNIKSSSVFLGIGLLFKLVLGAAFIPLILYYFWQQKNLKQGLIYLIITVLTVSIVTLPFFIQGGTNIFSQLAYPLNPGISGTTLLSAVKMVVNYSALGMASTYNYNPIVQQFAFPLLTLSLISGVIYIIKFNMKDKKIEFVRNVFIIILLVSIFGNLGYHHIFVWLVPYGIILFLFCQSLKKFNLSPLLTVGLIIVVFSTLLYAAFYRESKIPEYNMLEQSLLLLSVVLVTLGTYLLFSKLSFAIPWAFSTFAWALWLTNHSKLPMLLGSFIPIFRNPIWAYGVQDFSSVVLITISGVLLLVFLHRKILNDKYTKSEFASVLNKLRGL